LTRMAFSVFALASWLISRSQVINPIPSDPGPYFGPVAISFIEPQPDGKVVLAGNFSVFTGLEQKLIIRLNADGSFDDTFQPPPLPSGPYNQGITALVALPDGKLLVGSPRVMVLFG